MLHKLHFYPDLRRNPEAECLIKCQHLKNPKNTGKSGSCLRRYVKAETHTRSLSLTRKLLQLQICLLQSWKGQKTTAMMWELSQMLLEHISPRTDLCPKGHFLSQGSHSLPCQTNVTSFGIQFSDVFDIPLFHACCWSRKPLIKNWSPHNMFFSQTLTKPRIT